ncbi:hypothetical protein EYC84_005544 [Monilinia fructicola]|uniref:Uncharacterized protein n=1 Tax=Monilinia fructicola TaxID=38448 RepID=A0A5M9JZB8_MONFR|nr:hypothetical protein EYC84_005544 [Monilinia fructicola]
MRKHTHEKSKSPDCFIPIVLCIPALLFPAPACLLAFLRRPLVANGIRLCFIDTIFAFPCVLFLYLLVSEFHLISHFTCCLIFGSHLERKHRRGKSERNLYLYVLGVHRSNM